MAIGCKAMAMGGHQVVCHGIPSERVLKVGDIVNLDVTIIKAGLFPLFIFLVTLHVCLPLVLLIVQWGAAATMATAP